MAGKQNILLHLEGVEVCEQKDWLKAIAIFEQIDAPSAAIYFNIGSCYLQLKQYQKAEDSFLACVNRDKYLAVGYYQLGVVQTFMQHYSTAIESFKSCLTAMRGNPVIHYKQLNLPCKMVASEVRFNLALIYLFSGDYNNAVEVLQAAVKLENNQNHIVHTALSATLNENWDVLGQSPTEKLIKLSSSSLFHPSKAKLDGIKNDVKFKNSAKVVSATNEDYSFVGFVGPVKLQREKENVGETKLSSPLPSATPPTPSVAPPRTPRPPSNPPPPPSSKAPLRNIPSPPSLSPPTLKRDIPPPPATKPPTVSSLPRTAPPSSKPPSFSPLPKSEIPGKLSNNISALFKFPPKNSPSKALPVTPKTTINNFSPKQRPPPPAKENLKPDYDCNLTLSFSIPKTSIKNYDDFVNGIAIKLSQMAKEVNSGEALLIQCDGKRTALNSITWKDSLIKCARNSNLQLSMKEKNAKINPIRSPFLSNGKSSASSNSKSSAEDDVYVDASFEGNSIDEDEIYSSAVF